MARSFPVNLEKSNTDISKRIVQEDPADKKAAPGARARAHAHALALGRAQGLPWESRGEKERESAEAHQTQQEGGPRGAGRGGRAGGARTERGG